MNHSSRSRGDGGGGPAQQRQRARNPRASRQGLSRATGRDRPEWFALLDAWGAPERQYREIADWLTGEHQLSDWWAQKLIVEYEQDRGLRKPGVRPDGTFEVGASKTVMASPDRVVAAFVGKSLRDTWLPGARIHMAGQQSSHSLRFGWDDGASRVAVGLIEKGVDKTLVAVQHQHLPNVESANEMKAYWREHLGALKALLER